MYSDGADDEIHQQATWQHAKVQCISAEHRNGPLLPDRRENYSDEDDHGDAQEEGFMHLLVLAKLARYCSGGPLISRTLGMLILSPRGLAVYLESADTNQPIDYPTHELKFVVPYVKSVDVFVNLLQIISKKFVFDV